MWQEARKQEKHIKTVMVDYKKRAERRREYYERIKQDPIKFLRVYGRPSKLHVDSEVVKAAENPNNMMPWVGDQNIMIDRFDVRANLEHLDNGIPEQPRLGGVERIENRLCMYERYRCLIHNDYAGVTEAMCLKQIDLDEKYGDLDKRRRDTEETSKRPQEPKAAIGFTYEDSQPPVSTPTGHAAAFNAEESDSDADEADSDMDIDVELDLATLGVEGRQQLAVAAANYGLHATDFVRLLNADQQLETELRLAKTLEEEKLQLAGRKSRRTRRILKERRSKEKAPKLVTTKVGLLNGQPISRRTVYLSASSSDSGDYPSDVSEEKIDRNHFRGLKATADVRARRARAKPLLTNARGPSVMIGGMTSISLCRRRHNRGLDASEKLRKAGARSSSSSSRSSSSGSSRRSSSSTSSDRSYSSRRHRRGRGGHDSKRSRVEYITTFGDDDVGGAKYQRSTDSSSAISAVAASAVSRVLGDHKRPSVLINDSGVRDRTFRSRSNRDGSPTSGLHHLDRRRVNQTGANDTVSRGPRLCSSDSSRSRDRSMGSRAGRSPNRGISPRRSPSRSPLSRRLASTGGTAALDSPDSRLYETGDANPPRRDEPPVVVRKRYYRPELESDEQSSLSDESDGETRSRERRVSESHYSHRPGSGSVETTAGKMMTSQTTSIATPAKTSYTLSTSAVPRLTPQELLKRRVQLQLSKALIADKKAEQEKQEQLEQERQAREEGLRRQAHLLKRQEEKRLRAERRAAVRATAGHISGYSSDSSSTSSRSSSSARDKAGSTTNVIRGSVSQRARLSSNLTTGYHSRDFDRRTPPPAERRPIRGRYDSSPDHRSSSRNPPHRPDDHTRDNMSYQRDFHHSGTKRPNYPYRRFRDRNS